MAVDRTLTNDEREQLKDSPRFLDQSEWAVRDFAIFWTDDTTTSARVGEVGYNKWATNRQYSAGVLYSGINDPNISLSFVTLSKNMQLWDSAITPFNVDTCIDYMISSLKFEALASAYVNIRTQTYIF